LDTQKFQLKVLAPRERFFMVTGELTQTESGAVKFAC